MPCHRRPVVLSGALTSNILFRYYTESDCETRITRYSLFRYSPNVNSAIFSRKSNLPFLAEYRFLSETLHEIRNAGGGGLCSSRFHLREGHKSIYRSIDYSGRERRAGKNVVACNDVYLNESISRSCAASSFSPIVRFARNLCARR